MGDVAKIRDGLVKAWRRMLADRAHLLAPPTDEQTAPESRHD